MTRHVKTALFLVSLLAAVPRLSAAGPDIATFEQKASVTSTQTQTLHASSDVVQWLLENPLVIGKLWHIYGYAPQYDIQPASPPDICRVIDPTGITGNIQVLEQTRTHAVYWAKGKLTHWAAPVLNEGEGLFDIAIEPLGSDTRLAISVYILPKSKIAESALWVLSPILKSHINNRITLNLQDLNRILEDIAASPQSVGRKLSGRDRAAFEAFFSTK